MKKALVLAFALVLGLGIAAFATSPLSGSWSLSVSLDPDAAAYADFVSSLSSSLALDYTVGGWTFGSSSTFDTLGWSAQSFTASGNLGAFRFDSTMNFKPRAVTGNTWDFNNADGTALAGDIVSSIDGLHYTSCWVTNDKYNTKTYGAAFDDWTVTGKISLAGVDIEGLFFLEGYAGDAASNVYAFYSSDGTLANMVQTKGDTNHVLPAASSSAKTLGSGYRFKVSGTAGNLNITSYTYFNLDEGFTTSSCGQSLTKKGTYTISRPECGVGFTEEYLHVSGFSFGCATFEAGLDITCSGFNWVAFQANNVSLFPPLGLTGNFQVKFGTTSKTASLCFNALTFGSECFTIGGTLDYSGTAIQGFTINSVSLSHEWNGITFSSKTLLNGTISTVTKKDNQYLFMVPVTGMKDASGTNIPSISASSGTAGAGYYDAKCVYTEKYDVWEQFTVKSTGDSCCGGSYTFSITNSFGTKKTLKAFAYDYQFDNMPASDAVNVHAWYLYDASTSGETVPTVAGVTGGTDNNHDGAVDLIDYTKTSGATYAEQLLTGTVYRTASQDQLFQWVSTKASLSLGIGSAWTITGGLDINVYGWNSLSFGFGFKF